MANPVIIENDKSKEYFAIIPTLITQTNLAPEIIPLGEIWEITGIITSVPGDIASYALLKFGTELIFIAYSDRSLKMNKFLTGDGFKSIYIELKNGTAVDSPMGLGYTARKI